MRKNIYKSKLQIYAEINTPYHSHKLTVVLSGVASRRKLFTGVKSNNKEKAKKSKWRQFNNDDLFEKSTQREGQMKVKQTTSS